MEHDQKLPQASYSVAENISTVLIPLEVFFFLHEFQISSVTALYWLSELSSAYLQYRNTYSVEKYRS